MAPIKPHWVQPSHPDIQQVIVTGNAEEFTTKSISKIALPPFGLFARLDFPPCTPAPVPTYATVQIGRDKHIDLNSDLLYINHSCEPSLVSLLTLERDMGLVLFLQRAIELGIRANWLTFAVAPNLDLRHLQHARNRWPEGP